MPLVSIVIANYNYGRFLEEAICSVLNQSCQDVELIVCDGGSSDNSVEVVRRYADRIAWWVSEKDKGQSNAFNKGFSHARGRFLTWLNADDVMLPGTIEKLKVASERHEKCEWFVGGCFWLDPEMRIINCGRGRSFSNIRFRCGEVSGWGPSTFFTKRLLDAVGGVDERFHYSMDNDLWLRFALTGARYRPFCDYAWGLRLHPDAKMSGHNFSNSAQQDPNHPKWKQMQREVALTQAYFPGLRPPTKTEKVLSSCYLKVLGAKFDLYRFRGKHYLEYFK